MQHPPLRRLLVALLAVALAVGACSDDDEGSGDDAATTTAETTPSPEGGDRLAEWSDRGPYGVGSLQLDLDGRRTVVWYPAEPGAGTEEPTETFDITSLLSPDLQAQVPEEMRVQHPIAARPGAAVDPSGGPYPVVLFSHGFAGFPEQSAGITTHLASWGHVVVAPDHVERSLSGLLGTGAQGVEASTDPEVLADALDLVAQEADDEASELAGMVDLERVAVAGHSAGAGAAYRTAATDDRIDAFISYSLGAGRADDPLPDAPTVPALVMLGTEDETIEPADTRTAYDTLSSPRYLVEVADSGHLVFSDVCLIGAEHGGLAGIVEAIGLPIPDDLLRLASDGCQDGLLPVEDALPSINGLSVAFLRAHLDGDDEAPAALTTDAVEALGPDAPVSLTPDP